MIINKGDVVIVNCTHVAAGATLSPQLFSFAPSINTPTLLRVIDSDLGTFSGTNLIDVGNFAMGQIELVNVKLHATPAAALVTGTWPSNNGEIFLVNVDSGDTNNVFEYRNRLGTIVESTSVYLSGGAEFNAAGISWQITTTSACDEYEPFTTPWLHGPFSGTSEISPRLEFVHDSATDLTDRNCWGEFEYVSSSSFPIGTLATDRNAEPFTGSAVDHTNSSETWTGTGGFSNENKQYVTKTFTPAENSLLRARLTVAATSKTLYLNPAIANIA